MVKEIIKIGDDVLRQVAEPAQNNEYSRQVIEDLKDTLSKTKNGAGIAAPQIGESTRVFITKNYRDKKTEEILVFVNPEILEYSEEMVMCQDGCLSIPGAMSQTNRHSFIKVKYLNENFEEIEEELEGFQSVVFQHENDHLDGILFIDKLNEEEKQKFDIFLEKQKKGDKVMFVEGKVIEINFDLKK